jgi:hypothetical protein
MRNADFELATEAEHLSFIIVHLSFVIEEKADWPGSSMTNEQ